MWRLLEHQPLSRSEFVERIPHYLRQATNTHKAHRYFDQVLSLIDGAEYEDEGGSSLGRRKKEDLTVSTADQRERAPRIASSVFSSTFWVIAISEIGTHVTAISSLIG